MAERGRRAAGGFQDLPLVPAGEDKLFPPERELVAGGADEVVAAVARRRGRLVAHGLTEVERVVRAAVVDRAEPVRVVVEEGAARVVLDIVPTQGAPRWCANAVPHASDAMSAASASENVLRAWLDDMMSSACACVRIVRGEDRGDPTTCPQ